MQTQTNQIAFPSQEQLLARLADWTVVRPGVVYEREVGTMRDRVTIDALPDQLTVDYSHYPASLTELDPPAGSGSVTHTWVVEPNGLYYRHAPQADIAADIATESVFASDFWPQHLLDTLDYQGR